MARKPAPTDEKTLSPDYLWLELTSHRRNRHALVIGGTRGLGRTTVRALASEGSTVSVIGAHSAGETDKEIQSVHHWTVDISHTSQLLKTLSEIIQTNGPLTNLVFFQRYRGSGDAWAGELETSLTVTRTIIDHTVESFEPAADCSIVVISSIASNFVATEQPLSYHVAKAGLGQLARFYAYSLGPKGIRVNSVSPGSVIKDESKEFYSKNPQIENLYKSIIPLGRMGTSMEIANVVAFLCSPKSSFLTGQDIVVDGGISLQWHESMARNLMLGEDVSVTRPTDVATK